MSQTNWAQLLREEVCECNKRRLATHPRTHYFSKGSAPTIMFEVDGDHHGNFCDASYKEIQENDTWRKRLEKPHQRRSALPDDKQANARELDSSNSSDALLMNIFCYPDILQTPLCELLGIPPTSQAIFGFKAEVPLVNGKTDRTEIDMKANAVAKVFIESKFTEKDFTARPESVLRTYRDLEEVFEVERLPRADNGDFESYQLIRNVLAAHEHNCRFLLLCDARRPDLLQAWWKVHSAIRSAELRERCGFLLWQEIARVVPQELREYLASSRGIV